MQFRVSHTRILIYNRQYVTWQLHIEIDMLSVNNISKLGQLFCIRYIKIYIYTTNQWKKKIKWGKFILNNKNNVTFRNILFKNICIPSFARVSVHLQQTPLNIFNYTYKHIRLLKKSQKCLLLNPNYYG